MMYITKCIQMFTLNEDMPEIDNGNIPNNFHMKHIICRALTGTLKIIFKMITSVFFLNHTIRLKLLAIVMFN